MDMRGPVRPSATRLSTHSSMERAAAYGAEDAGSNPAGCAMHREDDYPVRVEAVRSVSPLDEALDALSEEISALGSNLADLQARLEPVSRSVLEESDRDSRVTERRASAPVVERVVDFSERVELLRGRVSVMIQQLEV